MAKPDCGPLWAIRGCVVLFFFFFFAYSMGSYSLRYYRTVSYCRIVDVIILGS